MRIDGTFAKGFDFGCERITKGSFESLIRDVIQFELTSPEPILKYLFQNISGPNDLSPFLCNVTPPQIKQDKL
jgi:hypothetical protein